MAEMLAEAFLSVLFEKLIEQLASPELRKNTVASKVKELEEKLKKVRPLVDDAEDRQLGDELVKEWLDDLKHVVFMADDMVEEIKTSKKEKKSKTKAVTRAFKSVYQSLAKTVQGEIDLILMNLEDLLGRADILELKHTNSSAALNRRSSPRLIAPLLEERQVFGRKADREEILKFLLTEEDKIGVLPIVGMGGLGKTTLAQLVFDDAKVNKSVFELRAWVTVSTEFDFCRIIKEILQKVNAKTDVNDPNELQRLMKEAVRGKRFLFVLDDVWDENYDNWYLLMSNFSAGDSRSRVIVTTRSGEVGKTVKTGPIYELKGVKDDDCWRLFVHHAFNGDANADLRLQEIGRRIVEKCKGLPLAIKSIGGLLRTERNPQKWENIWRSSVWSESRANNILPSLWLSYRFLPSSLKQCFSYCSLFPQDYEFDRAKMVLLWMAEGFVPSNDEDKRLEVGEQYFDDLVSRSLFQRSSEDVSKFVMHDLVHDLAAFVYGKFCFRCGEDSKNSKNLTIRTRHLSYSDESTEHDLLTSLSIAKHLRTIHSVSTRFDMFVDEVPDSETLLDEFVKEMVTKVRSLRVLSLSLSIQVLHLSLGDMKLLRYLDLSGSRMEEVPDSICSLVNLETLLLSRCLYITRLPLEMGRLIKLRHLDTSGSTSLAKMPPKMGSLKELRMLSEFVLGGGDDSGCSSLQELGELQHLGGRLRISELQNVDNVEDVRKANLRDKAEMKELILEWVDEDELTSSNTREEDVLDALRPHTNLERLNVLSYPGSSFPVWVGETSFSNMVYVRLSRGKSRFLPPLGQLPSLQELYISKFKGVEKIGSEFYGSDSSSITPFPSLETLSFDDMSSWKEWSFVGNERGCFSRLKHLHLLQCPNLGAESLLDCGTLETLQIDYSFKSLEYFSLDRLPNLKDLRLCGFPKLKALTSNLTEDRLLPSLPSFPTTLTSLTLSHCNKLKSLNGSAFQRLKSLSDLILVECNELESLPEQLLLPAVVYSLFIQSCTLLERRYQKYKGHDWHKISHIPQISIYGNATKKLEREEMGRSRAKIVNLKMSNKGKKNRLKKKAGEQVVARRMLYISC